MVSLVKGKAVEELGAKPVEVSRLKITRCSSHTGRMRPQDTTVSHSVILDESSAMRQVNQPSSKAVCLKDVSDHRCEITGVKFLAGLLND